MAKQISSHFIDITNINYFHSHTFPPKYTVIKWMTLPLTSWLAVFSHNIIILVLLLKIEVEAFALSLCLVGEALSNFGPVAPDLHQVKTTRISQEKRWNTLQCHLTSSPHHTTPHLSLTQQKTQYSNPSNYTKLHLGLPQHITLHTTRQNKTKVQDR